jgi:hypothetical protein
VVVLAALASIGGLAIHGGCKKEQESLIVAALSAVNQHSTLTSATIVATSGMRTVASKTFSTKNGISNNGSMPTLLGVYIPSDVTGDVDITATASSDTSCDGFTGTSSAPAVIMAAGDTVNVVVHMRAVNVCGDGGAGSTGSAGTTGAGTGGDVGTAGTSGGTAGTTGGTAGTTGGTAGTSGGTAGTTGTAPACTTGSGGHPALMPVPTLTSCTEYNVNDPGSPACNMTTGVSNAYINVVAMTPDGQLLATADSNPNVPTGDDVRIWQMQAGVPVACGPVITNPGNGPPYVAFSPNGKYLVIAWREVPFIDVYNVPSFTMAGQITSAVGPLYGVAFSPDSTKVISIDWDLGFDGNLYVDKVTGEPVTSSPLGVDPDSLAVAPVVGPTGLLIAVAGFDGNLGLYTLMSNDTFGTTAYLTASSAGDPTDAMVFSPDGTLLVASTDAAVLQFWNVPTTSVQPTGAAITLPTTATVFGLAFDPSGANLAVAYAKRFDIYSMATRAMVSTKALVTYADSVIFSPSGGALIGGEDTCGKFTVCGN